MAKATVNCKTVKVEKVVIEEKVEKSVVLELSHQEAATLAIILGSVGGSPCHSLRKYAEATSDALIKAGYYWDDYSNKKTVEEKHSFISFKDNTVDVVNP